MFTTLSFTSLVLILILGFVFRRTIRQATDIAPQVANDMLNTASVACRTLNENVITLAAENAVDVRIRAKAIAARAEEAEVSGVDITSLYNSIVGKS